MKKELYKIIASKGDYLTGYQYKRIGVMAGSHFQDRPGKTTLCGVSAAGIRKLDALLADNWDLKAENVPYQPRIIGWTGFENCQ